MKRRIPLSILNAVLLILLVAVPVFAAVATFSTVEDALPEVALTPVYGINLQPSNNTFYAQDRHWIIYVDEDTDVVYTSKESGGDWETPTNIVAGTSLYGWEVACWYDEPTNHVHYARHKLDDPDDYVLYRMGTPDEDGLITWAAAEQPVATTPGDLNNFRTTICLDKYGYPWVAWIDTNGVDAYGIVYVESSSTNNGTWTGDVSEEFDSADHHAWCVSVVPVTTGVLNDVVEVDYTLEDQTGGLHDGEITLWSQVYNLTVPSWVGDEDVVDYGGFYDARPDAFDVYNFNDGVYVVYTNAAGGVSIRVREDLATWAASDAATQFKYTEGIAWIPTISGYKARGAGEDLLVIVHNDDAIYYSAHTYGQPIGTWGDWTLAWVTPDLGNDAINRHVASYSYNSPIDFAWEYVDDSADPDVDVVNHWWIDNKNGKLGYYQDWWIIEFMAPFFGILAAMFIIIAAIVGKDNEHRMAAMVGGLIGLIFAIIAVTLATIL